MTRDADGRGPRAGGPEAAHDSDAALQEELRREAAERDGIGGDTATDRNLTGSSTWVTLGDASDDAPADQPDAPDGRRAAPAPLPDDRGDAALVRASEEVVARLGRRGVRLSGRETSEQLVDLLDAVERFERAAERAGADLLVDEPLPGALAPLKPDEPAFVLPVRVGHESTAEFLGRIAEATARAERVHRRPRSPDQAHRPGA